MNLPITPKFARACRRAGLNPATLTAQEIVDAVAAISTSRGRGSNGATQGGRIVTAAELDETNRRLAALEAHLYPPSAPHDDAIDGEFASLYPPSAPHDDAIDGEFASLYPPQG